jgi:hypothetical protein
VAIVAQRDQFRRDVSNRKGLTHHRFLTSQSGRQTAPLQHLADASSPNKIVGWHAFACRWTLVFEPDVNIIHISPPYTLRLSQLTGLCGYDTQKPFFSFCEWSLCSLEYSIRADPSPSILRSRYA